MQCDDHGHHCFMCDDHANGGQEGRCKICHNMRQLRTAICELCAVEKDTSFQRELVGVDVNDKDSPFRRVICYKCAKGDGHWMVPVEGYRPRRVLRHHQC